MLSSALRVAVISTKLLLCSFPPLENGFLDFPLLVFTLLFFIFYVGLVSDKLFSYFSRFYSFWFFSSSSSELLHFISFVDRWSLTVWLIFINESVNFVTSVVFIFQSLVSPEGTWSRIFNKCATDFEINGRVESVNCQIKNAEKFANQRNARSHFPIRRMQGMPRFGLTRSVLGFDLLALD